MSALIRNRLLYALPLLFGITFLTFICIQIAPGDFLDTLKLNPQISSQSIKIYQEKFYLDKPVIVQYFIWLKNILRGDLGYSFYYKAPVSAVILSRAGNSLLLSCAAIFFTWLLAIPLGVFAALKRNSFSVKVIDLLSYLVMALPGFLLAFLFLYFAVVSGWLPLGGMQSLQYEQLSLGAKIIDRVKHLIIPTLALSLGSVAVLQRIMRANLLEVLGSHYILGARARGVSDLRIIFVHALKNALNPMVTIFGYQLSALLSGAALVEIVLGWPGLGQVTLSAVQAQDIYLIMGGVLIGGVFLILGNLIADIMLLYFDPRIRYQ